MSGCFVAILKYVFVDTGYFYQQYNVIIKF
jgi:hypothetical protein